MFHCPKCNEVIGERMATCPFCKYEITASDVKKAREKEETELAVANDAMVAEWKKRSTRAILLYVVFASLVTGLMVLFFAWDLALEAATLSIVLGALITWGIAYKIKAGYCPYCDRNIIRRGQFLISVNCPRCGGKLK